MIHRPSIAEQLDQDDEWVTADGETVPLDQMSARHRSNVLGWLERHAEALQEREQMSWVSGPMPSGDAACDAVMSGLMAAIDQPGAEWLEEQPLVMRLRELAERDSASGAAQ